MTQYLVTTFKDSIGHVHPHVTAAKPNQTFTVVEAESKEEAKRLYRAIQLKNAFSSLSKGMRNMRKAMQRKDSE